MYSLTLTLISHKFFSHFFYELVMYYGIIHNLYISWEKRTEITASGWKGFFPPHMFAR